MKRNWKIIIGIIAGLVVVFIIIWTSSIGRMLLTGNWVEQPFNREQWKSVRNLPPADQRLRLLMLDNLMEDSLKTGLDSATVKQMLGEPERQHGFSYGLGTFTEDMDPLYLIIEFDVSGNVKKLDVHTENDLNDK